MKPLYHYTPAYRGAMILCQGFIHRSPPRPGLPRYLWASSNPTYEPTAARSRPSTLILGSDFSLRARFRLDGVEATAFTGLKITYIWRRKLVARAHAQAARPGEWFAVDHDLCCAELPLELEATPGAGRECPHAELLARFAAYELVPMGETFAFSLRERAAASDDGAAGDAGRRMDLEAFRQ
jgi:hypothetical protein